MTIRCAMIGVALLCGVKHLDAQSPYEGVEFCVVRTDTTIPFAYTGYSYRASARSIRGRVIQRSYPIVSEVTPNSPADNAGIRVDDELRSVFGFDLSRQLDSVRGRIRPGVPVPITLKRGDSTLAVTLTPTDAKVPAEPRNCRMPPLRRDSTSQARSQKPPRM